MLFVVAQAVVAQAVVTQAVRMAHPEHLNTVSIS